MIYTAVARTPYLKAEDIYKKNNAWNGGGLFYDNYTYWLNELPGEQYMEKRKTNALHVISAWPGHENGQGEDPGIYFLRLARDSWVMADSKLNRLEYTAVFIKRVDEFWNLEKRFYATSRKQTGRGVYYEEHTIINQKSLTTISLPEWEWADMDGKRIVWAEKGKIMTARLLHSGLEGFKLLYDTNPLIFQELTAPY